MSDLINRQAAIDALKHNQDVYSRNFHDDPIDKYTAAIIAADIDSLVNLPSAEPERKRGSWNVIQGNIVVCSECGMCAPKSMTGCLLNRHLEPNRTNFCPNCGADMRGEKHETD